MFDEKLKLSKPLKIIYAVYLLGALAISIYWTAKQTGPAAYLVRFQSILFLGRYFPVLTVFLLVLPLALPAQLALLIVNGSLNRSNGNFPDKTDS